MARIRPGLEEAKGSQIVSSCLNATHPIVYVRKRGCCVERAQSFDEHSERKDLNRTFFAGFGEMDCRSKVCGHGLETPPGQAGCKRFWQRKKSLPLAPEVLYYAQARRVNL